jgi:ribokinase
MRIVVFGSLNMDLVVRSPRLPGRGETVRGESFVQAPGGKGANQAVAAAALGGRTGLIGRVGDDAFGRSLLDALRRADVDTTRVMLERATHTGVASIVVDEEGHNQIAIAPGANDRVDADDAHGLEHTLDASSVVLLQFEVPTDASLAAARVAGRRGARVIVDPAPIGREIPEELLANADVITPNETEASRITGRRLDSLDEARAVAASLRDRYTAVVALTLGERGVVAADRHGIEHVPPFRVTAVDTVAAGDAFNGALAVAFAEGRPLRSAIVFAAAAGALATTKRGAVGAMPRRAEVEALASSRSSDR